MNQKTKYLSLSLLILLTTNLCFSQDTSNIKNLNEVVLTGQIQPQLLKNSVYEIKTISQKRIQFSGATNIQQVLNNQLGFRFSNDAILGTDVSINGVSGRSIKILLDGVPLLDRQDQRTSLSQIDINTVEKIEILEGPMAVTFGTDAMAGTINIITKKSSDKLNINAKVQEETAFDEYHPFSYKGFHTQNINLATAKNNWNFGAGFTHNLSSGFGGDEYGRGKSWLPKEQYFENAKIGFRNNKLDIYYRIDALQEKIKDRNTINIDLAAFARARDQYFTTDRITQQIQSNVRINNKLHYTSMLAFTNFKRSTETRDVDFVKTIDTLAVGDGLQDVSKLKSFSFKNSIQYIASKKTSLQLGIDLNTEKASGDRIVGEPSITDIAIFSSLEYKPTDKINIRPGFRIIKNSTYKAPPILPALNTKLAITKNIDVRLSYAMGYRAPALRELFFKFIDANHNIVGNPNLKAETSNNVTASFNWQIVNNSKTKFSTIIAAAYNNFDNQIELAQNLNDLTQYAYYNITKVETSSISIENKLTLKSLEASVGMAYIGNKQAYDAAIYKNENRNYFYSPEFNSNIIYNVGKIKTSVGFFYKLIGVRQTFSYEPNENPVGLYVTKTNAYNLADITITNNSLRKFTFQTGIKNVFNVTNVTNNSIGNSSVPHNGDNGNLSISYGRSVFVGVSYQFQKK